MAPFSMGTAAYYLYDDKDVTAVIQFMKANVGKAQDDTALGQLYSLFYPVIQRFKALNRREERAEVRGYVGKFVRAYAYITQLVRISDEALLREYQYALELVQLLKESESKEDMDLKDKIKLNYGFADQNI